MVLFSGCVGKQPLPITSDIRSFKDYILKKRANETGNYDIIAETHRKTIIEYRTRNEAANGIALRDAMIVIDDADEYCRAIGGKGIYGQQAKKRLLPLIPEFSVDYGSQSYRMKTQRDWYSGFYQCESAKVDKYYRRVLKIFAIEYMKDNIEPQLNDTKDGGHTETYSRYYRIYHYNDQKLNTKFWLKSDRYKEFAMKYDTAQKTLGFDSTAKMPWEYEKASDAQKYCSYNGGKLYIANSLTKYKKMDIEDYYFAKFEQIWAKFNSSTRNPYGVLDSMAVNIFMDKDYFWCENPNSKAQEFTLVHNGAMLDYKKGVSKKYLQTKGVSFTKATETGEDWKWK